MLSSLYNVVYNNSMATCTRAVQCMIPTNHDYMDVLVKCLGSIFKLLTPRDSGIAPWLEHLNWNQKILGSGRPLWNERLTYFLAPISPTGLMFRGLGSLLNRTAKCLSKKKFYLCPLQFAYESHNQQSMLIWYLCCILFCQQKIEKVHFTVKTKVKLSVCIWQQNVLESRG